MKNRKKWLLAYVAVFVLLIAMSPAWAIVVNALYDFVKISAPSNPPSGQARVYVDSGTNKLACLNSDGSSCAPSGSGGGFIQTLTAPVAASFTQLNFNAGSATTTQQNNSTPVTSISLLQANTATGDNYAVLAKSKLASTFTVTVGLAIAGTNDPTAGLWLADSTGGPNFIIFGYASGSAGGGARGLFVFLYSSYTTFSSNILFPVETFPFGPIVWLRVQETASARNYYTSADGILWGLAFTESNTAHFTTTQYGIGANGSNNGIAGSAGVGWYSFSETTP